MISNSNEFIRWTKETCNKYSVENLTDAEITVEVTGETNDYTTQLVIEPHLKASFEVPSDGVYKICVEGCEETIIEEGYQAGNAVKTIVSVFTFGATNLGNPIIFEQLTYNGTIIYDTDIHGKSTTAYPPATHNRDLILNLIEAAVGVGNYELVDPGATPILTKYQILGVDSDHWRLIIEHSSEVANELIIRDPAIVEAITLTPVYYCRYAIPSNGAGANWITQFTIEGIDLMAIPTLPWRTRYDQTNASDMAAFWQALHDYYNAVGLDIIISEDPFEVWVLDNELCCPDIESIRYSQLLIDRDPIVWCDYLYELCALHTCIINKLRDVMCSDCDPCKSDCSKEQDNKKAKARKDALYLSTLFFHGLVPLITKDRLNYLGDLVIDERRIECTMKLKEIYEKLVDFAKRCGECEECNDCDDCDCGCEQNTENCNNC